MKFILGLILGLLLVPVAAFVYLHHGNPPVATADQPLPMERHTAQSILEARIDKEAPKTAPLEANETNLQTGAIIYRQQCASCHGLYGHNSTFAKGMYPSAPQLWSPHGNGVVGVSDDPVGETYWKVANGIRLTGMPAYKNVLNETQMWQVSLLLKNADQPLPATALDLLKKPYAE